MPPLQEGEAHLQRHDRDEEQVTRQEGSGPGDQDCQHWMTCRECDEPANNEAEGSAQIWQELVACQQAIGSSGFKAIGDSQPVQANCRVPVMPYVGPTVASTALLTLAPE